MQAFQAFGQVMQERQVDPEALPGQLPQEDLALFAQALKDYAPASERLYLSAVTEFHEQSGGRRRFPESSHQGAIERASTQTPATRLRFPLAIRAAPQSLICDRHDVHLGQALEGEGLHPAVHAEGGQDQSAAQQDADVIVCVDSCGRIGSSRLL
jgi:hypothetical protein